MQYDRLVSGLAAVLGAITVVMVVLGLVYSPAILFVALMFGASTYFVYYHASGRMAASVYRSVERQAARNAAGGQQRRARQQRTRQRGQRRTRQRGGFDAGPREDWTPPRNGATAREAGFAGSQQGQHQQRRRGTRQRQTRQRRTRQSPSRATGGPTAAEAYRTLDLDPDADESSVKRAYRQKVKEVHPDTDGGDKERFKEVTAAYERLTD